MVVKMHSTNKKDLCQYMCAFVGRYINPCSAAITCEIPPTIFIIFKLVGTHYNRGIQGSK